MRRHDDPEIPARYYVRMGEVLAARGVDVGALMRELRIRPQAIVRPEAQLRLSQVEALVDSVLTRTGHTDLALDVGRALKPSTHSIVGYAMLSSPDVDYALRVVARYFRLVMPSFRMRYRAEAGRAEIGFVPVLPLSHRCLAFHLEMIAVTTYWELRELIGGPVPDCVLHLSIAPPAHAARYAELVGAQCRFNSAATPGLRFVFAADFRDYPLAFADADALKMAEARCAALVRSAVARNRVRDWVEMMLRESGGGMPSLAELAQTLNLSSRTLDRYLKREGCRFRALSLRVRHDRACELLGRGELSVTQIAHELGYTDAANFTRAFRRAAGCSPSAHRRRA
ncbi:AraC family transcriptional regulator [Solimonas marina]|uniref:AraC family transcriptional regulator n=1 Tax=Solimonas marina TaxID=2714601 RepID=A0A969W7X3_9GAMM|nr:AraC family transcriptional regulator [Solimonas marina]NKF21190.1 AraC family transcriptional regulator [Solimonas marina]